MHLAIAAIELYVIIYFFQKAKPLPVPHGLLIYTFIANIILYLDLVGYTSLTMRAGGLFGEIYNNRPTTILFFFIFCFTSICALGTGIFDKAGDDAQHELRALLEKNETGIMFQARIITYIVGVLTLINLASLNWSLVYHNHVYQSIQTNDALILENPLTILVHKLMSSLYILLIGYCALILNYKWTRVTYLCCALASWAFIFKLAQNSRFAIVYIAVFYAVSFMTAEKGKIAKSIGFAVIFAMSYMLCLVGRTIGENGLAAIYTNLHFVYSLALGANKTLVAGLFITVFKNFFEGIDNVADGFFLKNHEYPTIFKVLSLSPLPSAIDGFARIKDASAVNIFRWVPMPAVIEVINFGLSYILVYLAVVGATVRANLVAIGGKSSVGMFAINTLILVATIMTFAYPARNTFRFYIICLLLSLWALRRQTSMHTNVGDVSEPPSGTKGFDGRVIPTDSQV